MYSGNDATMKNKKINALLTQRTVAVFLTFAVATHAFAGRWSEEQANAWQQKTGWLVGCNFLPSTAINQLEMWQADSFDLETIDRELGWAESIGFNSVRVYLHDLLWKQDPQGFLKRIDQFLQVADEHNLGVMFVLFDSCWDPFPSLGQQRDPKPHVHNSGWVQSPGAEVLKDPSRQVALREYVLGVVGHFRNDPRILVWDVWNEPDNPNTSAYGTVELPDKAERVLPLLKKSFAWARQADPSQPLTSGIWIGTWPDPEKLSPTEQVQIDSSDVISFHNYADVGSLREAVRNLRRYHRPLLCTEYMSRGNGSTFEPHLGFLEAQGVSAYNWGLVSGKSQTIYPWDSWQKQYTAKPDLWFHDIFHPDGTPYRTKEVQFIRDVVNRHKAAIVPAKTP